MALPDEEKRAPWFRTFNAATDNPDNVAKARADIIGIRQQPKPAEEKAATESGPRPWWKGTPSTETKTGVELEQARRAAAGQMTSADPVQALLKYGVVGSTDQQRPATDNRVAQVNPNSPALPMPNPSAMKESVGPHSKDMSAVVGGFGATKNNSATSISSGLTADQRFHAADAFRDGVDRQIGIGENSSGGIADLEKRFNAYASNDDIRSARNAREDLLGSGIRFDKDAGGRLLISNSGEFNPIAAARGSSIDLKGSNDILARANAIRQDVIDKEARAASASNSAWIKLADEQIRKEESAKLKKELLDRIPGAKRSERAIIGQMISNIDHGGNAREVEQMRQQGIMAGVDTQRRGQDIAAKNEATRLAGNPVDNSLKQQQVIAAQGANDRQSKLNGILAGIEKEQDPAKRSALMDQYLEASGKETKDRFIPTTKKIYNEMGQIVGEDVMGFDKRTGLPVSGNAPAGNDAAQKIKADVAAGKMTREDAIKQLKAMGYN